MDDKVAASPVRIGLIGDIHNGPDYDTKLGASALALTDSALRDLESAGVDLLVEMGDRITNGTEDEDRQRLHDIAAVLRSTSLPRFHLLGNHDLHRLSSEEHEQALGVSCASSVHEVSGFSLVFWNPSVAIGARGFELTEDDLGWLDSALNSVRGPTVVFSHVPFSDASMVGNYYFQQYSGGAGNYINSDDARAIVHARPEIVACVAGHVHWNTVHTVQGVRHVTVQSLTECFTTPHQPAEARAILTLQEHEIHLEVRGRDPFELRVPTRHVSGDWLPPLTKALSLDH